MAVRKGAKKAVSLGVQRAAYWEHRKAVQLAVLKADQWGGRKAASTDGTTAARWVIPRAVTLAIEMAVRMDWSLAGWWV